MKYLKCLHQNFTFGPKRLVYKGEYDAGMKTRLDSYYQQVNKHEVTKFEDIEAEVTSRIDDYAKTTLEATKRMHEQMKKADQAALAKLKPWRQKKEKEKYDAREKERQVALKKMEADLKAAKKRDWKGLCNKKTLKMDSETKNIKTRKFTIKNNNI